MRLTIILLIAGCLQVSAKGYSQKITISGKDLPLEKVFSMVRNQTGYVFFYDYAIFQNARTVSLDIKEGTVEDVLNACFKGLGLEYKIEDKTISITKKKEAAMIEQRSVAPPADDHEVTGMVKAESGAPLSGATITILKLKKIGITNEKGEFALSKVPNGRYQVEISFVGYEKFTTEILVSDNTAKIEVALKQAMGGLDEIVVIPYGTTTQRLNTGDVSKVTSKEIEEQPVGNALAALEGRVPGLAITQNTGQPGGGFTVQIRGQNSILNGNDPFFVVDGVPYSSEIPSTYGGTVSGLLNSTLQGGNPLNYINPYDIESIEVLKDADATAIYGSRAANGAILITTKKGKAGPERFDIDINSGFTRPARSIQVLNTQQYLTLRHEAFKNDKKNPNQNTDFDLTFWDTTRYTDWSKVFLDNPAIYTNANASVSGGNGNTQYLLGAGYNGQTTGMPALIPNDGVDQRGSAHMNFNTLSSDKRFKLSVVASYVADRNTVASVDLSQTRLSTIPDAPPLFNTDGTLNWDPKLPGQRGTFRNPVAALNKKYRANTSNLISNATIGYTVLPGLELKASLGYTDMQIDEVFTFPTTVNDPGSNITTGSSTFGETNIHSWIIEPQADYRLNLGKGIFSVLIGGTFHENDTRIQTIKGTGYNSDALLESIQSAGSLTALSNSAQYDYSAVFGRLNYNWHDKYIVNLNARRDGSSRFGPGRQFGNFGSVGAAWIFSKEGFAQKIFPFLSFGKLRGSYGTTGNDQIGDYQFLNLYTNTYFPYFGTQPLFPENLLSPDLAWEIDKKLEGGIELGFWKDRITIQASIYRNRSGNQLVTTPVSMVTGFNSIAANLPAVVQNTGQEFVLQATNIKTRDFTWSSHFVLTIPRNKLISFPGLASSSYSNQYIVGKPITIREVYHLTGVNDTTGIYQFTDFKGNPTSSPNSLTDMTSIVNIAPKFYGGFLNSFNYKGFGLDIQFQFVKQMGLSMFGSYPEETGIMLNVPLAYYSEIWQKPGDKAKYQQASQNRFSAAGHAYNFATQSDLNYTDASFIRLKNLAFSWQLPEVWKQKLHLQSCRIYINAQNLLTITKYDGIDPESQGVVSPPKKVWTAGFQMSF